MHDVISLETAIIEAADLDPLENPEYLRGMTELLARCFPVPDVTTDARAKEITKRIREFSPITP